MKKTILLALVPCLFSISSFADTAIFGKLAAIDSTVQVIDENGAPQTYQISKRVAMAYVTKTQASFSVAGATSRCPPYLGQLAADFSFSVVDERSGKTTAFKTLKPTAGEKKSVWGECGSEKTTLEEVFVQGDYSIP